MEHARHPRPIPEIPSPFLYLLLLVAGWCLVTTPAFSQTSLISEVERQPNLIFIMLDDLDYYDLPAYGSTEIQTPALDRVVAEGMRLTQYYAAGPQCPPTRNSLLTGNYPSRHGIKRLPPESTKGIPGGAIVLPRILKSYGYTTAHVGKWHLGHRHPEYLPSAKGFDTSLVGVGYTGRVQPRYGDPHFVLDETTDVFPNKHATEALTDFAVDFIVQNQAGPFFLHLWYFVPHLPLECPPGWEPACGNENDPDYDGQVYRAMIANADRQIGRVFDKVRELGLEEDTFVLVTSDNGGVDNSTQAEIPPGQPELKGAKTQVFERGIKVPLLAWNPGRVPAGTVNPSLARSLDIAPTFEELARPTGSTMALLFDGHSLLSTLTGPSPPLLRQESLFWEVNFRDNDFKPPTGWYQSFAVRNGNWKLVMEKNHAWSEPRLFDLGTDPEERTNLASSNPQIVDLLMADYWSWRRQTAVLRHRVETVAGDVSYSINPDFTSTYEFTGNGGYADLSDTKLFDFGEADFSVSLRLRIDQGGTKPVLAQKPGSWTLSLTANNKLKLRVISQVPTEPAAVLVGNSNLSLGQDHDLAFTITGFRSDESHIRMYVDGVLQAQTSDALTSVEIVEEPVRVGNNQFANKPFLGKIEDLTFYLNALTQEEIDALVAAP